MIPNLQILRALAATGVLLFHAAASGTDYLRLGAIHAALGNWTMCGVDIFFVLSGFIMIHSQWDRGTSIAVFIQHRLIRIVPLYWLITSVIIALLVVAPGVFREMALDPVHAVASYAFVSRITLGVYPYIGIGWTLEYEMIFYVVFIAALFTRNRLTAFVIITILLLALWILLPIELIVLEFLFGVVIGLVIRRRWRLSARVHGAMLGVGVIALVASLGWGGTGIGASVTGPW